MIAETLTMGWKAVRTHETALAVNGSIILFGVGQLLTFPETSETTIQVVPESMILLVPLAGLFLLDRFELDHRVEIALLFSLSLLAVHGVTEAADEVVRPPLLFTIVFEHVSIISGIGLALYALWLWSDQRASRLYDLTRYKTAVDATTGPIYALDADRQITFANEAFATLLDTSRTQLEGTALSELVVRGKLDEETAVAHRRALETIESTGCDEQTVQLELQSGKNRRVIDTTLTQFSTTEQQGVVGVGHDVTELRRRKQELEVLNRLLRHNIRTELNLISGHASSIAEVTASKAGVPASGSYSGARTEASETGRHVREIKQSTDAIMQQSEKIQRFERLRSEGFSTECLELPSLLTALRSDYENRHPRADISIRVDDETTEVSPGLVQTILDELVENAVVHAESAVPDVEVAIRYLEGGTLRMSVTDDGPGLPEMEREVLREGSETQLSHSAGVGLWIVRWLVDYNAGTLSFAHNQPAGTRVTVELPVDS